MKRIGLVTGHWVVPALKSDTIEFEVKTMLETKWMIINSYCEIPGSGYYNPGELKIALTSISIIIEK